MLDFNEARDDRVAVGSVHHQHIIWTLLQTDNHASMSSLRPDAIPDAKLIVYK